MTWSSRRGSVGVPVTLLVLVGATAVAGCQPSGVSSLRWALSGIDLGRMAFSGRSGADGAPLAERMLDALGSAVERSSREAAEARGRWIAQAMRRQERPLLDAVTSLQAVDGVGFERMWSIDLVVRDLPAGDVLRDLADGMDLRLEDRLVPRATLARRVSLERRGVSRLEAFDVVCAEVGIHGNPLSPLAVPPSIARAPWHFDDVATRATWEAVSLRPYGDFLNPLEIFGFPADGPHDDATLLQPPRRPMIVLEPGPSRGRRLHLGPYVVDVGRPVEYPGDRCGHVDLYASFAAVPSGVRRLWETGAAGQTRSDFPAALRCGIEVRAEDGGHIDRRGVEADDGRVDSSMGLTALASGVRRRLVGLGPEVREVTVAGRVVAWLPGRVEAIRVDAPAAGPRRIDGKDVSVSIGERFTRQEFANSPEWSRMFEIPVEIEAPQDATVWSVELDERGMARRFLTPHPPDDHQLDRPADTAGRVVLRRLARFDREPAAIVVVVMLEHLPIERAFDVTLPLACHASQPAGPLPLEIDGERPLDLEAVTGGTGGIVFRVTNRSNKGIVRVGYSIVRAFPGLPHGHAMDRAFESVEGYRPREAVLVPTGGAVELPRDFFYNKGMDDQWPMLRVDEVEFSDGSTWVDPDRPAKDR